MHNIRSGRAPRYLSDIVQPTSARTTRSGLRSSSTEITSYVTHLGCAQRLENERFPFPVQSFRAYPADLYLYAASRTVLILKTVENFFQLAFKIH